MFITTYIICCYCHHSCHFYHCCPGIILTTVNITYGITAILLPLSLLLLMSSSFLNYLCHHCSPVIIMIPVTPVYLLPLALLLPLSLSSSLLNYPCSPCYPSYPCCLWQWISVCSEAPAAPAALSSTPSSSATKSPEPCPCCSSPPAYASSRVLPSSSTTPFSSREGFLNTRIISPFSMHWWFFLVARFLRFWGGNLDNMWCRGMDWKVC